MNKTNNADWWDARVTLAVEGTLLEPSETKKIGRSKNVLRTGIAEKTGS